MEEYLGTVPLRIFTTARQQVTPPHLDVLFMATATIVVEANEAVSGPLSVQFLTKRKVSFFLPPPPCLYASFLLPQRPLLFPSVRHRERKRGRDTKFEPGKWAQWRWKRRGSMLRSWSKHLRLGERESLHLHCILKLPLEDLFYQ